MPTTEPPRGASRLLHAARAGVLYSVRLPIRIAVRARVLGEGRAPLRGGLIVAANHASFADPVVLQSYLPRHLTYLMTERLYHLPGLHWFFRFWGVLSVKEDGLNKGPLRAAERVLASGGAVGIFPEGGISRDGLVHDARPGIAALARRAGVPILPVGLAGIERLLPPDTWRLHPSRVALCMGDLIDPEGQSRDGLAARVTRDLRACAARAREALAD